MTLYLEQISLINSRVRLALKAGDSKTIIEATNRLCKGNQKKADQLAKWFIEVTESCKQNAKISSANEFIV